MIVIHFTSKNTGLMQTKGKYIDHQGVLQDNLRKFYL